MKVDGACHCGAIAFEAEIDPARVSICHCADCQTLSGSPYRASVAVLPADFQLLRGTPKVYVKVADSGARRAQAFCGECGAPLYATSADDPQALRNVRIGAVRQRDSLPPQRQIWTASRQRWADDIGSLPGTARQT